MGYEREIQEESPAIGTLRSALRVIHRYQVDIIVGRLLTYIEATYSDPQQRKAHKDIVKQLMYGWFWESKPEDISDDQLERLVSKALEDYFSGKCINRCDDGRGGCSDCPPSRFKEDAIE